MAIKKAKIRNLVVVSDTHVGSTLGLSVRHRLDDGGIYVPSKLQKKLWAMWQDFWKWTYGQIKDEPFILVHNGDIVDGVNKYRTTTLSSFNLAIQSRVAIEIMEPHTSRAAAYYQIRGTEAHAGQSAQEEETIAATLGAIPDKETGQYSRWEMWLSFGDELIHFAHHISATVSTAYESSAPMREMVAGFVEAGQWGRKPPTLLIRSHRHRFVEVKAPNGRIVVTPAWQLKTPYVHRLDRMRAPQFGGLLIRQGEDGGTYIREKLYTVEPGEIVKA